VTNKQDCPPEQAFFSKRIPRIISVEAGSHNFLEPRLRAWRME
jgi:hypothetical protein